MKIFIRSTSCISPQQTFNHNIFYAEPKEYVSNILNMIEPDYKNIIDPKQMRRMSRIVRTGLAAAKDCLKEAGTENVDAIITGTAYGCMEDSETFLKKIVEQDEEMLSPTSFIQSTHNTVGAQIALSLKCHNYNNTFVHRGFSFEHALIDSLLLFNEDKADNILAGSADEITGFTFSVLKRLECISKRRFRILICIHQTQKEVLPVKASHSFYYQTRLLMKTMQALKLWKRF